jgi:hypothetical protein
MESQNSVHIATRHIGIERGYAVLAKEMNELSRRDYFAAAALTGIIFSMEHVPPFPAAKRAEIAAEAYALADAMIETGRK